MLMVNKGQYYVAKAEKCASKCEAWVAGRVRQRRAIAAAVSNLEDHFATVEREVYRLHENLTVQHENGERLLTGFEDAMALLYSTRLHPLLPNAMTALLAHQREEENDEEKLGEQERSEKRIGGGPGIDRNGEQQLSSSDAPQSLAECIPVHKYRPYVSQCRISQDRLKVSTQEIMDLFERLKKGVVAQCADTSEQSRGDYFHCNTEDKNSRLRFISTQRQNSDERSVLSGSFNEHSLDPSTLSTRCTNQSTPMQREGSENVSNASSSRVGNRAEEQDSISLADGSEGMVCAGERNSMSVATTGNTNRNSKSCECDVAVLHVRETLASQKVLLATIERDYQDVRTAVLEQLRKLLDNSSYSTQAEVGDLEKRRLNAVEKNIPTFEAQDVKILSLTRAVAKSLDQGTLELRQRLSAISQLQRSIVNLQQHIKLRADALKQQREDFAHLEIVHRLPDAYACFVAEVKRRRFFEAIFKEHLSKNDEELRRLYDNEVAAREAFLISHGRWLPPCFSSTFLPSLFQKPPNFRLERTGVPPPLPDLSSSSSDESQTAASSDPIDADNLQQGALIMPAPKGDELNPSREVLLLRHRVAQLELELASLHGEDRMKSKSGIAEAGSAPTKPSIQPSKSVVNVDEITKSGARDTCDDGSEILRESHPNKTVEDANTSDRDGELVELVTVLNDILDKAGDEKKRALEPPPAESNMTSVQRESKAETLASMTVSSVISALRRTVEHVMEQKSLTEASTMVSQMDDKRSDLAIDRASAQDTRESKALMISFQCFSPGNVVLFLPVNTEGKENRRIYLAFNEGCPRHYLNEQSANFFRERNNKRFPNFIVGRIIVIDPLKAGPLGDRERNPFDLKEGTVFHVVTIEGLKN